MNVEVPWRNASAMIWFARRTMALSFSSESGTGRFFLSLQLGLADQLTENVRGRFSFILVTVSGVPVVLVRNRAMSRRETDGEADIQARKGAFNVLDAVQITGVVGRISIAARSRFRGIQWFFFR